MANNRIQVKRTNVADRTANVTNSGNTQYIAAGEFALNMADGILYTSNGSALIAVGANNATISSGNSTANLFANSTFLRIANSTTSSNLTSSSLIAGISTVNTTVVAVGSNNFMNATALDIGNTVITTTNVVFGGTIAANGGIGTLGQVLTSGAAGNAYWTTPTTGTVTSVATGNGMTGGPITTTGTVSVLANTGIIANTTGTFVNATYIATIASNTSLYSNGSFTNTFTVGTASYFVSNGNLGIGTSTPSTKLSVNPKVIDDSSHTYDSNTVYITHQSPTATATLNDPKPVLILARQGTSGQAFGAAAEFNISRYENNSTNSRTRMDIRLADGVFLSQNTAVMTMLSNGSVGIGNTTPNAKLQVTGTANVSGNVAIAGITTLSTNVVLGTTTITANGSVGTAGQVLTSGAAGNAYWSTVAGGSGTVTSVASGNGITGGTITATGTLVAVAGAGVVVNTSGINVLANTGIIANTTGTFVNATYIGTISANNASFLGTVAAASYVQNTDTRVLSGNLNFTGTNNFFSTGLFVGANVSANTTALFVGNSTVNATHNSALVQVANSTASANQTAIGFVAGISTVNTTVVQVGTNNYINATALDIGNSVMTSVLLTLGGQVNANGGVGTAGQVLTSGAAGNSYWTTPTTGTVTSVATGNGMTGGTISTTGTVSVLANTGIVANATGTFVNASYIATITANNATFINGNNVLTVMESLRANRNLHGGGTITVDGSGNILWSARYIVISNGRGAHFSTDGYFDINCPTSGTITGVGGATNKTATAAGIPLGLWEAIYYILPIGSASTSVAANFRVVSYTTDVEIPSNWILICLQNADNSNYYFNNGVILKAGQSFAGGTFTSANMPQANNANNLGTVAAASYVQNTDSRTLSGNLVISGTSFTPSSNTILLGNSTQRWVLSANTGSFSGAVSGITTLAAGNTTITGFANVTTTIQGGSSLTIAGALSGVTTSAMGNTTITGFVNATSSVNAASHTVGTAFTANSTVVNAVSYYAGTLLVANSTVSNATHLGGVAAASYVQNTDSRVLSGNLNFTGTNNFFSTGLFVGANVIANTTALFVGNSTANSTTNATAVTAHIQHASRPTLGFNYTVANTVNSLIVGPYQVNTGFTLTVETGARLVIA